MWKKTVEPRLPMETLILRLRSTLAQRRLAIRDTSWKRIGWRVPFSSIRFIRISGRRYLAIGPIVILQRQKKLYDSTRTSDFILSAFALFSRMHSDASERSRWEWVLQSTKQAALCCGGSTGLLPDFLTYNTMSQTWQPARAKLLESEHDGALNWNACRTPWRLAHYLATTGDPSIVPLLQHAHRSVRSSKAFNFPTIPAGVDIAAREPKALVDYTDKAFIAPVGYLCYVLGDTDGHSQCVTALNHQEPGYFGDSIDVCIAEQAGHAHEWF